MNSLLDIYNLSKEEGNVNEKIAEWFSENYPEYAGIEWGFADNSALGYDTDLEVFLLDAIGVKSQELLLVNDKSYAYTSIKGLSKNENYIFLYDGNNGFYVQLYIINNRFDDSYPDEWWLNFNNMYPVPSELIDKCDMCSNVVPKDLLINITVEQSDELQDLKEEYINFDGMICQGCYEKMHK